MSPRTNSRTKPEQTSLGLNQNVAHSNRRRKTKSQPTQMKEKVKTARRPHAEYLRLESAGAHLPQVAPPHSSTSKS